MPPRVVLDINILISGLLWRGKPHYCVQAARAGIVQAVYCPEMLAELSTKLEDKFEFSADQIQATVYDIRSWAIQVEIQGDLHVVTADPDDDKFVECAQMAGAEIIVSGDRHLLDLGKYAETERSDCARRCRIVLKV
jgi:putative PIN family toxin of toxin-antitoxin system